MPVSRSEASEDPHVRGKSQVHGRALWSTLGVMCDAIRFVWGWEGLTFSNALGENMSQCNLSQYASVTSNLHLRAKVIHWISSLDIQSSFGLRVLSSTDVILASKHFWCEWFGEQWSSLRRKADT